MLLRSSWLLASLGVGVAVVTTGVLIAACSEAPATNFGTPTGLRRENIPGEGGAEPLICTGVGSGDGGGGGGDGGGGEGGACAVSWATDIFPKMKTDGPWHCADAKCHGAIQPPIINVTTPSAALDSLKDWKIPGSPTPYIITAGAIAEAGAPTDPTKSTIECNLQSQCGQGMPQSPGKAPTHDEMCVIHAWLLCGAPNN